MTLDEIKAAVRDGHTVCWSHAGYEVHYWDAPGPMEDVHRWSIVCLHNQNAIGLTWLDGVTVNGKPEEFFIREGT